MHGTARTRLAAALQTSGSKAAVVANTAAVITPVLGLVDSRVLPSWRILRRQKKQRGTRKQM